MPVPITLYKCTVCGQLYHQYKEAQKCEEREDKCRTCANGYYVYGCEFNCEYSTKCNFINKYPYYKPNKESCND